MAIRRSDSSSVLPSPAMSMSPRSLPPTGFPRFHRFVPPDGRIDPMCAVFFIRSLSMKSQIRRIEIARYTLYGAAFLFETLAYTGHLVRERDCLFRQIFALDPPLRP